MARAARSTWGASRATKDLPEFARSMWQMRTAKALYPPRHFASMSHRWRVGFSVGSSIARLLHWQQHNADTLVQ